MAADDSPESMSEIEGRSERSPGLSFRDVWDALPGWVTLTIVLVVLDLIGMYAFRSRLGVIAFLGASGIVVLCVAVWLVLRKR